MRNKQVLPGTVKHVDALPQHLRHAQRRRLPTLLPARALKSQCHGTSTTGGNITDELGRWLKNCGGELEGANFHGRELRAAQVDQLQSIPACIDLNENRGKFCTGVTA